MEASTDTQARRGGDCGRAIHGGEAMAALGCGGERGGDGSGGERERRGGRGRAWGRVGGRIEEAGGAGDLIPRLVAGEGGSVGTRPVPTRVGGTGEGDAVRELGRLGRPGWLRARGVGRWPCGWVGLPGPGGFPPFLFFCNFFLLFIFPFCFI